MKFRVTIEQEVHPPEYDMYEDMYEYSEKKPYWKRIKEEEIKIDIAEKAARQIEKLIRDEGLDINSNDLRRILFEELHEKPE